jgi:hypothetical protein
METNERTLIITIINIKKQIKGYGKDTVHLYKHKVATL